MLIEFTKPQSLNGIQLLEELSAAGVTVEGNPISDSDASLWLDIDESKQSAAAAIVAAHVGVDSIPTVEEKLANAGLTIDELKAALGV